MIIDSRLTGLWLDVKVVKRVRVVAAGDQLFGKPSPRLLQANKSTLFFFFIFIDISKGYRRGSVAVELLNIECKLFQLNKCVE